MDNTEKKPIEDAFGVPLRTGQLVAFIRGRLMIIGTITEINGYKITVQDEQDQKIYKVKSHKVSLAE